MTRDLTTLAQRFSFRAREFATSSPLYERLALATVAAAPPRLIAGDALAVCPRLAREVPAAQALIVFHAATRAHVPQALRPRFDGTIAAMGEGRRLFWLSLEGPLYQDERIPAGVPAHVLALREHGGDRRTFEHLALVEGHAEWLQPLDLDYQVGER